VETAIVSVVLIILVLGIVDMGRVIFTNISIRDAVQEGTSFAAYTENATADEISDRIRSAVSDPDLSTASISLFCSSDPRDLQDATRIRVDMTYDVDLVTPLIGSMFGGSFTLSPSAEADRFFVDCPIGVTDPIPTP
jgi:Flp pilus assembly protein TadG